MSYAPVLAPTSFSPRGERLAPAIRLRRVCVACEGAGRALCESLYALFLQSTLPLPA